MKTGARLAIGFSAVLSLILVVAFFSVRTYHEIHKATEVLEEDVVPGALAMGAMEARSQQVAHDLMDYVITAATEEEEVITGLSVLVEAGNAHLEHERHIGPEERKAAEELMAHIDRFTSACMEIVHLKDQGLSVDELLGREEANVNPALAALVEQLEQHKAAHLQELAEAERAVHGAHAVGLRAVFVATVCAVLLAGFVAWLTTRSIVKPLRLLEEGTRIVAKGHLDHRVDTERADEIGQLGRAFDRMTENLSGLLVSKEALESEIVERKQAEKKLYESERRFRAIFDQTFQFIGLMTPDGTLIEANRSALSFAGIEEAEVLGKPFWETCWWTHSSELQDRLRDAVGKAAAGQFIRYEAWHPAPDGSIHYMDLSIKPMMDESGEVVLLIPEGRDITERKQVEEAKEKLLHDMGERVKELTCMYGASKAIRERETLEEVFREVAELIPPGWRYPEIARGKICFEGQEFISKPFEETEWKQTSDIVVDGERRGRVEVYYLELRPDLDEGPFLKEERHLLDGIAHALSEVINRKRAEEQLAMFRKFAEASGQGLGWADLEGRILYINEALCRMFGEERREDTFGEVVAKYYDEETQRRLAEAIFPTVLREGQWMGELDIHNAKGEVVPTFNNLFAIRDEQGTPICYANVLTDITERKRAEEQLAEAHRAAASEAHKLRSMIEGMDEGIVVADADDMITEVNEWFLAKVGLRRDDIVGKSLWEFHPDTEATTRVRAVLEAFRSGQCRKTHVVNRELLGMQLSLRAQPLFGNDRYLGVVLNVINVTDLVEARQAAEAANQSKSGFLANMSHEIRTPMTAILGFADNLLEPGLSESEKVNAIHTIRRNGDHLLQIINDILDISKIEAGKLEVERISCSPIQLLADIKSLMQVRADAKGLGLDVEYIGAIPETIQSDPTRLKQILVNLIGNAIKFTETGGVRLVSRFVGRGSIEPMMQFDVIDTGIGMTAEQVSRLFQAFAQGDASTTRKFGGTGLGLTISRRLVEMLGGGISVDSRPGEGSTFRVTIAAGPLDGVKMLDHPAQATFIKPGDATSAEPPVTAIDCHILLAEDGVDNQRLVSHVLKKAGAKVTVVENGKLAVDTALAARDEGPAGPAFGVVLMDMQMPVMDGYEATSLLRRKGYTGPIIALTAHAMASDQQKCLNAGCDDYATKPIDRRKLIETIRKHLGGGNPSTDDRQDSADVLVSGLANDPGETELVEMFVAELPGRIAAFEKVLIEQDVQTLARLAHQLKGSAGGYGFPAITRAAKDLEMSAKAQEDSGRLREDLDRLADRCRHAQAKAATE